MMPFGSQENLLNAHLLSQIFIARFVHFFIFIWQATFLYWSYNDYCKEKETKQTEDFTMNKLFKLVVDGLYELAENDIRTRI